MDAPGGLRPNPDGEGPDGILVRGVIAIPDKRHDQHQSPPDAHVNVKKRQIVSAFAGHRIMLEPATDRVGRDPDPL